MEFSQWEKQRYSRQIVLSGFSLKGQELLKNSSVLIVGCGGLGSIVAMYLCGAGVGRIGLLDGDVVDLPNLHRQIIHSEESIDKKKVVSSYEKLRKLNSTIKIDCHDCTLKTAEMAANIFQYYDVIVDCTDSVSARYIVNGGAVISGKAVVFASVVSMNGQLSVFNYRSGPCYRCIVPEEPPPNTQVKAADVGVLGPVVGILGSMQALETLKVIVGESIGRCLRQKMLLFNGLNLSTRIVCLAGKLTDCPCCGDAPRQTDEPHFFENKTFSDDGITVDVYKNLAKENKPITVIDVRPSHEFAIARIEKSLNFPLDDLNSWELPPNVNDFVLIVCRRGYDSRILVNLIKENMKENTSINCKYLIGGLSTWKSSDPSFPLY